MPNELDWDFSGLAGSISPLLFVLFS